jgi:hypothetical protein
MTPRETPVLLIVFNRVAPTTQVVDAIRQIAPKHLFVAADGPRRHIAEDRDRCEQVRALFDAIDWDCDLRKLYREENLGCKRAVQSAITWFFEQVEGGVILEDDCLPTPSFFLFASELLDRYRDAAEVMCISGNNFHGDGFQSPTSYYFSKYMHCWGWASWARAWKHYDAELSGPSDRDIICNYPTNRAEVRFWSKRFRRVRNGRIDSWDYGWQYAIWKNHGLVIVPQQNLVKNIGFGGDGTHTQGAEDEFALEAKSMTIQSHPQQVTQDIQADQREATHVFKIEPRLTRRVVRELRRSFRRLVPRRVKDQV